MFKLTQLSCILAMLVLLLSATFVQAQLPCTSERPSLEARLASAKLDAQGVYRPSAERREKILKNYGKVNLGMTREQVVRLLGEPDYEQATVRHAPIRADGTRDTIGQCSYQWGYYFEKVGNSILDEHDAQLILSFNTEQLTWAFPQNIRGLAEKGSPADLGPSQRTEIKPEDRQGYFITPSIYVNPALEMALALPGEWQIFDKELQQQMGLQPSEPQQNPNCRGPLCNEDVNVALISRRGAPPMGSIFIGGYQLPVEYLDRKRFPLEQFAQNMLKGSLDSSDWIPIGEMTAMKLGSHPAYRLLVHKTSMGIDMKGFGYVAESNGHIFLIVASAAPSADAARLLQSAVEKMTLTQKH